MLFLSFLLLCVEYSLTLSCFSCPYFCVFSILWHCHALLLFLFTLLHVQYSLTFLCASSPSSYSTVFSSVISDTVMPFFSSVFSILWHCHVLLLLCVQYSLTLSCPSSPLYSLFSDPVMHLFSVFSILWRCHALLLTTLCSVLSDCHALLTPLYVFSILRVWQCHVLLLLLNPPCYACTVTLTLSCSSPFFFSFFSLFFKNFIIPCGKFRSPYLGKATVAAGALLPIPDSCQYVLYVCGYIQTMVWLPVHPYTDAYSCIQELYTCGYCKIVCTESTLRASLSGTFLQTLPELVTPLKGHSLPPQSCPLMLSVPSDRFGY